MTEESEPVGQSADVSEEERVAAFEKQLIELEKQMGDQLPETLTREQAVDMQMATMGACIREAQKTFWAGDKPDYVDMVDNDIQYTKTIRVLTAMNYLDHAGLVMILINRRLEESLKRAAETPDNNP